MEDPEGGTQPLDDEKKKHVQLTVQFEKQSVQFKLKQTTPFEKVFKAVAEKFNISPGALKFIYQNDRIRANDTPFDFQMEDGDVIDANLEQVGGF